MKVIMITESYRPTSEKQMTAMARSNVVGAAHNKPCGTKGKGLLKWRVNLNGLILK
jgi:hypothetical protein